MVKTTCGMIEGINENGLIVFKGIPYAALPTGRLRWQPPQPLQPWQGIRKAQSFSKAAPQLPSAASSIRDFRVDEDQSEDCLYLNIWTPAPDKAKRPVMVWIHGGYFTMGSGAQQGFRGDRLAVSGDVVVVTLNYRLGLLGFLNLNGITGGKIPATGNEGLLDQIAALKWIHDNIAEFGGNPDNITLFGESAGAQSIECLMAMPSARGLFHKAILESSIRQAVRPLVTAVKVSEELLRVLDLKSVDVEQLLTIPAEKLLAVQQELGIRFSRRQDLASPVIDDRILPQSPQAALESGTALNIPVIMGTNLEETRLFSALNSHPEIDEAALIKRCQRFVPDEDISKVIETYRECRIQRNDPAHPLDVATAIQTDALFRLPAIQFLDAHCRNRQPTYSYIFTWKSPARNGAMGACHGLEIGFVFGTYESEFGGVGAEAEKLSRQIQDAWTSFARTGNPSCESLGNWPQYCDHRKTMLLGKSSRVEADPLAEERNFWDILR
jgi:para-nitrobenzyl esterase